MVFSDVRTRKITRFFELLDRDHDGVLTADDPEHVIDSLAAIRSLEPGSPRHESFRGGFMAYWNDLLRRSDTNSDGRVTLADWLRYHERMLADEAGFEYTVAFSAGLLFALMDVDESGNISLDEFSEWMTAWGVATDALAADDFARLDLNGDGTLSQTEVLELMSQFYYSDDPEAPGNWIMGPF